MIVYIHEDRLGNLYIHPKNKRLADRCTRILLEKYERGCPTVYKSPTAVESIRRSCAIYLQGDSAVNDTIEGLVPMRKRAHLREGYEIAVRCSGEQFWHMFGYANSINTEGL
jgi:hypothetical protein